MLPFPASFFFNVLLTILYWSNIIAGGSAVGAFFLRFVARKHLDLDVTYARAYLTVFVSAIATGLVGYLGRVQIASFGFELDSGTLDLLLFPILFALHSLMISKGIKVSFWDASLILGLMLVSIGAFALLLVVAALLVGYILQAFGIELIT